MTRRFIGAAVVLGLVAGPAFGASRRAGFYIAGHGDPAPSSVGLNVGVSPLSPVRLHAGVGGENDWLGRNAGTAAVNYTLRPLLYPVAWLIYTMMYGLFIYPFTGKMEHLRYSEFLPPHYSPANSVFSYGGGAQLLLLPSWALTPTFGAGFARYASSGRPNGLADSGRHLYYRGGLDFQSGWLHVAAGYNYCPKLPVGTCGVYGNLGLFF